jgi:divalent metal cation (Fe/Co/Zn/Cd) transporter
MSNHHYEKWLLKLLVGIVLIGGGVFFLYYSVTHLHTKDRWVLWGLTSAISITIGALLLSSATIHKVKSDLIRKQKMRHQTD